MHKGVPQVKPLYKPLKILGTSFSLLAVVPGPPLFLRLISSAKSSGTRECPEVLHPGEPPPGNRVILQKQTSGTECQKCSWLLLGYFFNSSQKSGKDLATVCFPSMTTGLSAPRAAMASDMAIRLSPLAEMVAPPGSLPPSITILLPSKCMLAPILAYSSINDTALLDSLWNKRSMPCKVVVP